VGPTLSMWAHQDGMGFPGDRDLLNAELFMTKQCGGWSCR